MAKKRTLTLEPYDYERTAAGVAKHYPVDGRPNEASFRTGVYQVVDARNVLEPAVGQLLSVTEAQALIDDDTLEVTVRKGTRCYLRS